MKWEPLNWSFKGGKLFNWETTLKATKLTPIQRLFRSLFKLNQSSWEGTIWSWRSIFRRTARWWSLLCLSSSSDSQRSTTNHEDLFDSIQSPTTEQWTAAHAFNLQYYYYCCAEWRHRTDEYKSIIPMAIHEYIGLQRQSAACPAESGPRHHRHHRPQQRQYYHHPPYTVVLTV